METYFAPSITFFPLLFSLDPSLAFSSPIPLLSPSSSDTTGEKGKKNYLHFLSTSLSLSLSSLTNERYSQNKVSTVYESPDLVELVDEAIGVWDKVASTHHRLSPSHCNSLLKYRLQM